MRTVQVFVSRHKTRLKHDFDIVNFNCLISLQLVKEIFRSCAFRVSDSLFRIMLTYEYCKLDR